MKGTPQVREKYKQADGEDILECKWFEKSELSKLSKDDFVLDVSYKLVKRYLKNRTLPLEAVTFQNAKLK